MNAQETLDTLKSLGTEQNRKIYRRHGAGEDVYGVSFAHLKDLKKKIKIDHDLAVALWESGNHDARMLAGMIADPKRLDARTLDTWVKGLRNYVETDALGGLAAKSPHARETMARWIASDEEWTASAGWRVLAQVAMDDDALPDEYFERFLSTIERDIDESQNRVRHEMNNALIAIGIRNPALQEKAVAAAARIGKVEVDHGETGCKTPDAAGYIRKTVERKK
ncbi:MAG TPA: DNA alkylation repair protein [Thermoanaerobaculia bacterium]|jgi:3-methyladenine DNA glycosylase AlkD|nr:DNA alkylation repair protein [Thermoanaerobaculia bacterium]